MGTEILVTLIVFFVVLIVIGGVAFVMFIPSDKEKVNKRVAAVSRVGQARGGGPSTAADTSRDRRKQVQETLKQLEESQKEQQKKLTLRNRLEQAGLDITVKTFHIASAICGAIGCVIGLLTGQNIVIALFIAVAAGLGMPRWYISMLTKRRQKKFLFEFSNAIDVIVRGVKSGLPVNECLKVIATEGAPPVNEEFQDIVEGLRVGMTLEQVVNRMYERIPLPEVNFFSIVLVIQQKTGGNLAEALGNLAEVLRDRKRLKGKIDALSSEAKASAAIIGSLPFMVAGILMLLSPDYMMVIFVNPIGQLLLIGCAISMTTGILIMRAMINVRV